VSEFSACWIVAPHIIINAQHSLSLAGFRLQGEHQECIIFVPPEDLFLGYKGTARRAHIYRSDSSVHIAVIKARTDICPANEH